MIPTASIWKIYPDTNPIQFYNASVPTSRTSRGDDSEVRVHRQRRVSMNRSIATDAAMSFAILVLHAYPTFACSQEQPSIEELISAVSGPDSIDSAEAIEAIAKLSPLPESALQVVVKALHDNRPAVRVPYLVPSPVPSVGSIAADTLAGIGKQAVHPLCVVAISTRRNRVRILAIQSLGRMAGKAADALSTLTSLLNDENDEIRLEVVAAIISIQQDSRELAATLGPVLSDRSPNVRVTALMAIGELGELASMHVARIVELLDDRAKWTFAIAPDVVGARSVREVAAMTLAEMGDDARVALPRLRMMMKRESQTVVRVAAAYAICRLDDVPDDALKFLMNAVLDDSYTHSPQAAEAIGKLGPKGQLALSALIDSLPSSEPLICCSAIKAIALVSPDSLEQHVLPMTRHKEPRVRESAIEALVLIRHPSASICAAFVAALDDSDPAFGDNVRHAAVLAIGSLQDPEQATIMRLRRLIDEESNASVRESAIKVVRNFESSEIASEPGQE